jgi:hypothetical protein
LKSSTTKTANSNLSIYKMIAGSGLQRGIQKIHCFLEFNASNGGFGQPQLPTVSWRLRLLLSHHWRRRCHRSVHNR